MQRIDIDSVTDSPLDGVCACLFESVVENVIMTKYDLGLLILRVATGSIMLTQHGLMKVTNFHQLATQFPDPFGFGSKVSLSLVIFAEVFCSGLLVLGLFTRMALIPLITTMAVAFFIIHGADPFLKRELSLVFMLIFSSLFVMGPGQFSVQETFKISAGRFSWLLK